MHRQQIIEQCDLFIQEQVVWGHMDAFQHVNNTVYFRYFENVRLAYLEKTGMMELKTSSQLGPILASTQCDFRAPLTYPDQILIGTWVENIEDNKFDMHYIVFSEKLGRIAAEGKSLIVFYDYANGVTCNIPANLVQNMKKLGKHVRPV